MQKRRTWFELGALIVLAATAALLWRAMRPEEPAPPLEPAAWTWTKVAERSVPGGAVSSLASGDVAGDPAPDLVAVSDHLYVLEEGKAAAPVDLRPDHAARYASTFGRGEGAQRIQVHQEGGPLSGEVSVRAEGRTLWRFKTDGFIRMTRWGDLDGDGVDDLAVASFSEKNWTLTMLDGRKGDPVWAHPIMVADLQVLPRDVGAPRRVLGPGDGCGVYATEFSTGRLFVFTTEGDCLNPLNGPGNRTEGFRAARLETGQVQVLAEIFDPTRVLGGVKSTMRFEARSAEGRYLWSVRDEMRNASLLPDASGLLEAAPSRLHAADLDGDGVREWVMQDRPGRLLVKSSAGRQVATLPLEQGAPWTVLERPGATAVLVTGAGDRLTSWQAKP